MDAAPPSTQDCSKSTSPFALYWLLPMILARNTTWFTWSRQLSSSSTMVLLERRHEGQRELFSWVISVSLMREILSLLRSCKTKQIIFITYPDIATQSHHITQEQVPYSGKFSWDPWALYGTLQSSIYKNSTDSPAKNSSLLQAQSSLGSTQASLHGNRGFNHRMK